jgi:hypothetical protein
MRKPKETPDMRRLKQIINGPQSNERERVIDYICWVSSERASLDTDMPHERCANIFKEFLDQGRFVIHFDEEGDRLQIINGPNFTMHLSPN